MARNSKRWGLLGQLDFLNLLGGEWKSRPPPNQRSEQDSEGAGRGHKSGKQPASGSRGCLGTRWE